MGWLALAFIYGLIVKNKKIGSIIIKALLSSKNLLIDCGFLITGMEIFYYCQYLPLLLANPQSLAK